MQNSVNGTTAELLECIVGHPNSNLARKARDFILGLALCHTCLPETREGMIDFQAASPDELALVRAAQDMGFLLVHRSSRSISLLITDQHGKESRESYEILDVIEFSSKRKRMSILVRRPGGQIWLLCKGADSTLLPRLKQAPLATQQANEIRQSVEMERRRYRKSLHERPRNSLGDRLSFDSRRGRSTERTTAMQSSRPAPIRTQSFDVNGLVGGATRPSLDIRPVSIDLPRQTASQSLRIPLLRRQPSGLFKDPSSVEDAAIFKRCFEDIDNYAAEGLRTLLFVQRLIPVEEYKSWKKLYDDATTALNNREERIDAAGEVIEQSFDLLGVSAIEDKLQKGVPETVEKMHRANIKIWMLTGDKRETAISIAHSAHICRLESDMFILDVGKGDMEAQMRAVAEDLETGCAHSVAVIDGHTLSKVDDDAVLRTLFFALIPFIDSVICCRASPAQKADIVKGIKARVPSALTLAIGDGSNDIAMIQASHVGVGISGKEGLQAYRAADYSIAQFRFLQRLILVHGRWNYVRTARFILLTFWKEMFFYMPQALYQHYTGYTGTSLYESWSLVRHRPYFSALEDVAKSSFFILDGFEYLVHVPLRYCPWHLRTRSQG